MNAVKDMMLDLLLSLHDRRDDGDYREHRDVAVRKLAELAREPADGLRAAGDELIQRLDREDVEDGKRVNRALHVLFDWIEAHRWAAGRELVEKALLHPRFHWKERYIQVLDEFADPASIPVLLALLRQQGSMSEADVDVRAVVIQSLTSVFKAANIRDVILPHLEDPAPRVRRAAAEYVWTLDIVEAGDALIARLAEEDDPSVFELILECLERWRRTDALPVCEQLVRSMDPALTDFIEPLTETIEALSNRPVPESSAGQDGR